MCGSGHRHRGGDYALRRRRFAVISVRSASLPRAAVVALRASAHRVRSASFPTGVKGILIWVANSQHSHSSVGSGRTKSEVPGGAGQFVSNINFGKVCTITDISESILRTAPTEALHTSCGERRRSWHALVYDSERNGSLWGS